VRERGREGERVGERGKEGGRGREREGGREGEGSLREGEKGREGERGGGGRGMSYDPLLGECTHLLPNIAVFPVSMLALYATNILL
jgi:hypothetical protein